MPEGRALEVTVFSREGCHLCEAVVAEIKSIEGGAIGVTVVDIDTDRALQAEYLTRVPVVAVGGREIFEANLMDAEGRWKRLLLGTLSEARPPP